MIDPKIMNQVTEQMAADGDIISPKTSYNNKMDDFSDYDEFVPPETLPSMAMYEDDHTFYQTDPKSQFREGPEDGRPEMPYDSHDQRVFFGGPLQSELESWKKQHGDVWVVDDLPTDEMYVYRDINRYEYKAIMATPNTDPLMREELICEQCVLFPYDFSYSEMSNGKAGIVTVLAQHIMETSGFTRASIPRKL